MKAVEFHGYFKQGKLIADGFKEAVRNFAQQGFPVVLTVKRQRPTRSNLQNAYYWAVVVKLIHMAINESGIRISSQQTHEMLRVKFLAIDTPINEYGEFIQIYRSTTELSTVEFMQYIEHCVQFAAEYLNVVIPEPNTQLAASF